MALFRANANNQLAMIAGKYEMSAGMTDVIGGTMTAGTMTASALLTFAPAFVSAPIIVASLQSGIIGGALLTASNYMISFTGVTVSNAYMSILDGKGSGATVGIVAIGLCKL